MSELKPLDVSTLVPALNPTLVTDGAGLEKLRTFLKRVAASPDPAMGWDYETPPLKDFWFRRPRVAQFGDRHEQFIVDYLAFCDGNEKTLFESGGYFGKFAQKLRPILDVTEPYVCSNAILKVGVNLPFDYETERWNLGTRPWHFFSCDLAERVIVAGKISLKMYSYFSMESLIARYFGFQIDKESQTSFDLCTPLTEKQIIYGALDTRMPLAIRAKQLLVLRRDGLEAVTQLENDSIGAFSDMHLNGQRLDKEKWLARFHRNQAKLVDTLKALDNYFLPIVGSKIGAIDHVRLNELENIWRSTGITASAEEIEKAGEFKRVKDPVLKAQVRAERDALTKQRSEQRAAARATFVAFRQKCNAARDLLEKCEGDALINYNSDQQVLNALYSMRKGFNKQSLPGVSIDALEKFTGPRQDDETFKRPQGVSEFAFGVAVSLQDYSDLKKKIGTYGAQWVTPWTTKPCKEEGWLHPGDGRLHSRINQLEAETGRTSSIQPNTQNLEAVAEVRSCFIADPPDEAEPEGYVIVTVDQSGAELRIIAEQAQADSWIIAFNKGQDVHAVGTEIMYPKDWPLLTEQGCAYFEKHTEDKDIMVKGVLYQIRVGDPKKQKCKCKGHKTKRDGNKAANFKLAYGGKSLADDLGCTEDESREIMGLHEQANPDVWAYLRQSGTDARVRLESRSMFGRRRLFHQPTWEGAADFWRSENATDECPNPTTKQIASVFKGMFASIERRGKNHPIQATNVDIAKRSMGTGYDKDGKPYLWHTLPSLGARMLSFVHDELIVQAPKRNGQAVADMIADAFRRAGDEVFTRLEMTAEYHIAPHWQK